MHNEVSCMQTSRMRKEVMGFVNGIVCQCSDPGNTLKLKYIALHTPNINQAFILIDGTFVRVA